MEILQETIKKLQQQLDVEKKKYRALEAKMKANTPVWTDFDKEIVDVFENLLGKGDEIGVPELHLELAKKILQLDGNPASGNWPNGWSDDIKEKLGFPRKKKFTSFIDDISQIVSEKTNHRIEFNSHKTRIKYAN